MVAIMVIEGLGRSLDPNMDILAYARPAVLNRAKQSIRESVKNRLKEITNLQ
jgi:predicted unusual protein kinase regulating ubiquinone biosynthesis (AarF/ABC1/UbiB family)